MSQSSDSSSSIKSHLSSHLKAFLLGALLLGVSSLFVSTNAYADISKQDALSKALRLSNVEHSDIREQKIQRERESDIPVYKLEFATDYGDFDFAYAIRDGRLIDADFEIDEEFLDTLRSNPMDRAEAVDYIAHKLGIPVRSIEARREGNRIEARAYHKQMVYEIELDTRTGVIYDFNADLRQ